MATDDRNTDELAQNGASDSSQDFPSRGVWHMSPEASRLDLIDELTANMSQLCAMAATLTGEQFETFDVLSDTLKENYLWALAEKIEVTKLVSDALIEKVSRFDRDPTKAT